MTIPQQGYSTASPVLEYPPRPGPRHSQALAPVDTSILPPGTGAPLPDGILEAMKSDSNSFNMKPYSEAYKSLLNKRLQLPVYSRLPQFCKLYSKRRVIIVTGGTGTGKTTQLPQFVAYCDLPQVKGKMIAVTQPRRVTTVSVAGRVAAEMDFELGREVGYSVRFDEKTTPGVTFLRYMTDGKLLHEAMYDADFSRYSTVIIDEAHERTAATDILMALLKSVMKRRHDLKVIIMSATLDASTFQQYFSLDDGVTPAPLFNVRGESYPVDVLYIAKSEEDYVQTAIDVVFHIHANEGPGDILLFLTGEREIEHACKMLTETVKRSFRQGHNIGPLDCVPLYSLLSPEKQKRIFEPAPKPRIPGGKPGRKVIVATNVAETSLTIDGIYFVVDPGFCKQKVYLPRTKMSYMRVMGISKASARQRKGRAGRTGPGKCYRLYTKDEHRDMVEKNRPEVLNIDLSDCVLKMLSIGVKAGELTQFDFIDAPAPARFALALETLAQLGGVDENNELTEWGRMMAEFPLEPRLSKALLESVKLNSSDPLLTIAAMLSTQGVWCRPYGEERLADRAKARLTIEGGDHLTLLNVFNKYVDNSYGEVWAKKNYLSAHALDEGRRIREQLHEMLHARYQIEDSKIIDETAVLSNVRRALVSGFFVQVAVRGKDGNYRRVMENGERPLKLHPSCTLKVAKTKPKWIVFDEVIRTRAKDASVMTVTEVTPQWLLDVAPHYYNLETLPDGPVKDALMGGLNPDGT